MANPNIVNVSDIRGKTAVSNITTEIATIVTNSNSSNTIYKVNSLIISNIDGANNCNITADIFRSNVSYKIASTIVVPADASLIVIAKDISVYLEEGDSLRLQASANGDLQAICSYEEIK